MKNKNGNTAKMDVLRSCLEKAGDMQSTLNIKSKNGRTRPNGEVQRNSFMDQIFVNQRICMEAACQKKKWVNFLQAYGFQPELDCISYCHTIKLENSRQIYDAIKPEP